VHVREDSLAVEQLVGTFVGIESLFHTRCQHMLNDIRIRQAKPRDRDYKLTDYDGLHLLVRKTGSKLWRFAYRRAIIVQERHWRRFAR